MRIGLAACVLRSIEIPPDRPPRGLRLPPRRHGARRVLVGRGGGLVRGRTRGGLSRPRPRAGVARSELLSRIVESGAAALVVPHVDSAEEARFVVERVRFAPRGRALRAAARGRDGISNRCRARRAGGPRRARLEVLVMNRERAGPLRLVDETAPVRGRPTSLQIGGMQRTSPDLPGFSTPAPGAGARRAFYLEIACAARGGACASARMPDDSSDRCASTGTGGLRKPTWLVRRATT